MSSISDKTQQGVNLIQLDLLEKINDELIGIAFEYENKNKDFANGVWKSISVMEKFKENEQ